MTISSTAKLGAVAALSVVASAAPADSWAERKCALYEAAFADALNMQGTAGIGDEFLRLNDDFIGSGCATQGHVCPHSPEEHALANMLTLMTMNEGMASTFVPFGCKPVPEATDAD